MALALFLHLLGGSIWVGGHLILAIRFVPQAWRLRDASELLTFEHKYEPLGMTALGMQIATGLHLAWAYSSDMAQWFDPHAAPIHLIGYKLIALLLTALVAAHARFRVIPKLYRQPQGAGVRFFCLHVLMVTLLAVSFVYLGVAFRFGAVFGGV